jgi:hypothetical protein
MPPAAMMRVASPSPPLGAAAAASDPSTPGFRSSSISANDMRQGIGENLCNLSEVMEVCKAAVACARLCSSSIQLLGCANLGCTTPPAPGLGGCEASLVVNRRGSVCGGCGVVRYCSAACAQQDWPGHRRVCRRLAAAAAVRGANRRTGGVS